ncbi:MAG: GtrA family protein [Steroidobacteraceae bacterium]
MRLARPEMSEFFKYAAASGAALLVDAGVLATLVSGAGWPYMTASAISFVAGGVFLYFLSIKVVFRFRRVQSPALELPLFIALGLVGLAVNCLVIFIAVGTCHVNYLVAKGAAAVCTFSVNYLLRRNTMFSRLGRGHPPYALAE